MIKCFLFHFIHHSSFFYAQFRIAVKHAWIESTVLKKWLRHDESEVRERRNVQ